MTQFYCSSPATHVPPEHMLFPERVTSGVLVLCFVLGLPGNIAVLAVLICHLKEDCFTHRLMLNLAVSDLLTLLSLLLWIWTLLNSWTVGFVACKILSYEIYCYLYSSTLCVTLMNLQRYMQVLHPHICAKLGAREKKGFLCGIWMVSGVLASYVLVQYTVGYDQNSQFQSCYPQFRSDTELVATSLLEIVILAIFFSLLVYFYCSVHRGVSQSPFFRRNRMTKLITRIVVVIFIFWIPIPIKNVFYGINIAGALVFINSCVNPFLYTFSLRERIMGGQMSARVAG
uniref:G-protein coupled receptors family 1 profile domain-containing protein n=1 Tax=Electrophorus electricus TaxID=8005 RepID=A0A4W4F4D3_ELEEL